MTLDKDLAGSTVSSELIVQQVIHRNLDCDHE